MIKNLSRTWFACRNVIGVLGWIAFCVFWSPAPSYGQEEADSAPVVEQDEDGETAVLVKGKKIEQPLTAVEIQARKLFAAKKFQLVQVFAVESAELKQVCDLNNKQILKLKIAAKGAVKKISREWLRKYTGPQGVGAIRLELVDDEDQMVVSDADEIDSTTHQALLTNNFAGNPYQTNDPRDSRFWKSTVSSVLSNSQHAKYLQYKLERKTAKRESMIQFVVMSLSVEIGLSKDQLPEFEQLVRPSLEMANIKCVPLYEPYVMYYFASKVKPWDLKKILSPAQVQKWKMFMTPMQQIGQMMAMDDDLDDEPAGVMEFAEVVENVVVDFAEAVGGVLDQIEGSSWQFDW